MLLKMNWLGHFVTVLAVFIASLFGVTHQTPSAPFAASTTQPSQSSVSQPAQTETNATSTIYFDGKPSIFLKDANFVYQYEISSNSRIQNADPNSFTVLGYLYFGGADVSAWIAKDKNHVYYDEDGGLTIVANADPVSFTVIDGGMFAKDKNHVYDDGGNVFAADVSTFVSLGGGYYKDKNGYYTAAGPFSVSAPATFKVMSNGYAKDAEHVYHNGVVTSFDPDSFVVLDDSYVKDKSSVYLNTGTGGVGSMGFVQGADPNTFKVLPTTSYSGAYGGGDEYAEDTNYVYFDLDIVKGADPKTFVVLNARYGKDKSHVYFLTDVVPGADPASFTVFSQNIWFGKDATHVYTGSNLIAGADPLTFKVCGLDTQSCQPLPDGTNYNAYDKNHYYEYEKVVQ